MPRKVYSELERQQVIAALYTYAVTILPRDTTVDELMKMSQHEFRTYRTSLRKAQAFMSRLKDFESPNG